MRRLFDPLLGGGSLLSEEDLGAGSLFDPELATVYSTLDDEPPPGADPDAPLEGAGPDEPAAADETPDPAQTPDAPAPQPDEPPPASPSAPLADDPPAISLARLLQERPDVLKAYYTERYGAANDPNSTAWTNRIGADNPESYARYWYDRHGKYEGYNQGATTAGDNVDLGRILHERPDVLRAFYSEYYSGHHDRHPDGWVKKYGGEAPEDYARYWYEKYGKWEGYAQTDKQAAEAIDVERLLVERPDVFRAFYTEYFGANNDRHSSAWVDRVGGDTIQDYAKYWYTTYGRWEGYNQRPAAPQEAPSEPDRPSEPSVEIPSEDPSLDPWNHPALYPDAQRPPELAAPPAAADPAAPPEGDILSVGRALTEPDIFA